MNLLREYIRHALQEAVVTGRKLDRYSTAIKRHVMRALKDPEVRDFFREQGEAQFKLQDVPELDEIDYLRDVIVSMEEGPGVGASASYAFDLDATPEQRKTSDLNVNLSLPRDYKDQVMSQVNNELTDAIRHELEHSGQETWELMDCGAGLTKEEDIWKSLKNAAEYYMCPGEIKAHVTGFMKRAKSQKKDLFDAMDLELYRIHQTGVAAGYTEAEMDDFMVELSKRYHDYAKDRYPAAKGYTGKTSTTLSESVMVDGISIDVEIVSTHASRQQGLMFRHRLGENSGMLFVFPSSDRQSFWMKNTPLPLSIAYADVDGRIINIEDMHPHDERNTCSSAPAIYALEMNQGWFRRNGVCPGSRITGLSGCRK